MTALLVAMLLPVTILYSKENTWMGNNLEYAVRQALIKIGPFRIRPTLVLSNAGYDSNVYGTADHTVGDYSVTVGPAFSIYIPIKKKIIFSIYESPQYVYFLETESERAWNNYLTGQVNLVLNRFFISAGAGMNVAREIWSTEIDIRPRRTERSVNGDFLWQVSRRVSVQASAREASLNYESLSIGDVDIEEALNRTERRNSGTINLQLTSRVRAGVEYERARFEFEDFKSPRNSDSRAIYGKVDFDPSWTISGRIRIGVMDFRFPGDPGRNIRDIAGDSSLIVKLGRRLRIRGSFARTVQFSTWVGYAYFIESRISAGVSFYPVTKIRLDYQFYIGNNFYPISDLSGQGLLVERTDRLRSHRIGIIFRIKEGIGIGPTLNWWHRDSTLAQISGQRFSIGANLIYDF